MEDIYTIELSDGTVINNINFDGFYFSIDKILTPEVFLGKCSPMIVRHGNNIDIHEHTTLGRLEVLGNKSIFRFRDLSKTELNQRKLEANLAYIAMMTDINLED